MGFPTPASAPGGVAPPSLAGWQWAYNGLTMGAGTSYGVLSAKGMALAAIRHGDVPLPRDSGELVGLDVFGGRDVSLDLWMTGSGGLVGNDVALGRAVTLGLATEQPLWFQFPGSTNLVPNPSFEYDTVGSAPAAWIASGGPYWQSPGATLTAQTSAGAVAGSQAMRVITTSANNSQGAFLTLVGTYAAGVAYTATVYMRGSAGGEIVDFLFGNGGGADNANLLGITLTTAWQRFTLVWTPTTAETNPGLMVRTHGAVAQTFYADAAMVTQTSGAVNYFDGDTGGYYWTGTPGDSPSAPLLICAMGRARKRDMPWDANYAAGAAGKPTLQIHCTDPRLYTPAQITTLNLGSHGSGGLAFPVGPFPVTFGGTTPASATVYNQGNFESRPILVFTGPLTNPWVANGSLVDGPIIQLHNPYQVGYTIAAGDQVLVDLNPPHRMLYYTGGIGSGLTPTSVRSWLTYESSWFNLPPGPSLIQFGSQDSSNTGGSAQIWSASAYQL